MGQTKIRIDLDQGIVEAEGSETFVKSVYHDFKQVLSTRVLPKAPTVPKPKARKAPKQDPETQPTPKGKGRKKKRPSPSLVKDLDLRPNGKEALGDFFSRYEPKSNFEKNLIFIYWLREIADVPVINVNHVYTCYREIPVSAPKAFYQSLIDTSNKKGWIDTADIADIKVTVGGVNYFNHNLSEAAEAK